MAESSGTSERELGKATALTSAKVQKIVKDFRSMGLPGLMEAPRSGRLAILSPDLKLLMKRFTEVSNGSTGRTSISKIQGVLDVSDNIIWREARQSGLKLERRRSLDRPLRAPTDPGLERLVALFVEADICVAVIAGPAIEEISLASVGTWFDIPKAVLNHAGEIHDLVGGLVAARSISMANIPDRRSDDLRQRFLKNLADLSKIHPGQLQLFLALDPLNPKSMRWLSEFRRHRFWTGKNGLLESLDSCSWEDFLREQEDPVRKNFGPLANLAFGWPTHPFTWWRKLAE